MADLLVEEKIVIELKTVDKPDKIHEAQIISYLKARAILLCQILNYL